MTLKKQFGQRLRTVRNEQKISQETLAQLCDCSVETISHIERGIHGPRFDMLEALCSALQCEPKSLFNFSHLHPSRPE